MEGRYGGDQLTRFSTIAALILLIVSSAANKLQNVSSILFYLAIVIYVWSIFRMMSRNTVKRSAENDRFLEITERLRGGGSSRTNSGRQSRAQSRTYHREQKKIYKFFKCPKCGQKIRVPKGRGKICITCPKCRMEFVRKS